MLQIQTLSETMAALRDELSSPVRRLYDALVWRLTDGATAEGALKAGDRFPEFALPDHHGRFVLLSELLRHGPLVINFYRGQWCPFCSATVAAMSAATPAINTAGATVIGISPEIAAAGPAGGHWQDPKFRMLCDLDNGLALECGLVFRLTEDIIQDYLADGLDFAQVYGNSSWFLPIPASYVVASDGAISRAYVNPDFRYRLDPEEVLRAVEQLRPC